VGSQLSRRLVDALKDFLRSTVVAMRTRRLSPAVIVTLSVLFVVSGVAGYLLGAALPPMVTSPTSSPPSGGSSKQEAPGLAPQPESVSPSPPGPTPTPSPAPNDPTGGQVKPEASPTPLEVPAAGPIPKPPSRFHVQAGAFKIRENAQVLIQQLRAHDFTAALVESAEGPPYRVWVGCDLGLSEAEHLAAVLRAAGFETTLISR